jgi:Arc/MetJ family transcription regulator
MSTPPPPEGAVRSAETVNAAIRALLERTRRRLSDAERAEYEGLVREYAAAVAGEMTTAA